MELLEQLRERKNDHVVGYIRFAQQYNSTSMNLHCFYEAKHDRIYYNNLIRNIIPGIKIESFLCKNKEGVLQVYEIIQFHNHRYSKIKKAFFVDRDFDPLINNNDIYETPWHSIEN